MAKTRTPLSSAYISKLCEAEGQEAFAKRCGVSRAVLSLHVTGERDIRDNHLAAYLSALGSQARAELLAAWLRDMLPPEAQADLLEGRSATLRESVTTWRPQLHPTLRAMLEWWAETLPTDPELAEMFLSISRRVGFEPAEPMPAATHAAKHQHDATKAKSPPPRKAAG